MLSDIGRFSYTGNEHSANIRRSNFNARECSMMISFHWIWFLYLLRWTIGGSCNIRTDETFQSVRLTCTFLLTSLLHVGLRSNRNEAFRQCHWTKVLHLVCTFNSSCLHMIKLIIFCYIVILWCFGLDIFLLIFSKSGDRYSIKYKNI